VFGLCTTLYALFSGGRLPFPVAADAGVDALREAQLRTKPVSLRALVPEIDPELARLVGLGLSPDAGARPDVSAIVLALECVQRAWAGGRGQANRRRVTWRVATV
jgi:hypothetical protein